MFGSASSVKKGTGAGVRNGHVQMFSGTLALVLKGVMFMW